MEKNQLKTNWQQLKPKIQQQFRFRDDELNTLDGSYEGLERALQRKFGYSKEKADKELDAFLEKIH